MDLHVDERRVALEAIATLVDIKSTMAELLLKPAGVPLEVYRPLLARRDETTGRPLTKRQIAPLLLDALEHHAGQAGVVRRIVEIAAQWTSFHLAHDEYAARATVQKAREVLGTLEAAEAREVYQRETARKEELARMERERASLLRQQSDLLLLMFDELSRSPDRQQRGYLLQDLLNRLFDLHGIPVHKPFVRNDGGEQIDGAFKLDNWYYLVECRWRQKLADIRDLDGLRGQIGRSGRQTMGLFLSIEGWSDHVPPLLKQNPDKCILLMEGYALRMVLSGQVDFQDYLLSLVAHLNLRGEPALTVADYMAQAQR